MAQENHTAAQHTLQHGFYGACVSRSYYACFQAMWVALGDPPLGRWEHGGLMRTFCRGQWANPILLPTSLAPLYKRLLTLYDLRLDADYRALPITLEKAQEAVQTVAELFHLISQHTVVEQENPL
jgi:uncharacterized protein (UPF0332 family)